MVDRDRLFQALFDRLKAALSGKVATFERRLLTLDQVMSVKQPALCVVATKDRLLQQRGLPTQHVLTAGLVLYNREKAGDPETPQLKLVDALDKALERAPSESVSTNTSAGAFTTTLNGLVEYCQLVGDIEFYQGADGEQAVVLLQVEMLALNKP